MNIGKFTIYKYVIGTGKASSQATTRFDWVMMISKRLLI